MPVNDYLVPLVTCTLTDAIICLDTVLKCYCILNTIIVIIIRVLGFFVVIAILYTSIGIGIGIARGQYYWILDIGCLSWYRSNSSFNNFSLTVAHHYTCIWMNVIFILSFVFQYSTEPHSWVLSYIVTLQWYNSLSKAFEHNYPVRSMRFQMTECTGFVPATNGGLSPASIVSTAFSLVSLAPDIMCLKTAKQFTWKYNMQNCAKSSVLNYSKHSLSKNEIISLSGESIPIPNGLMPSKGPRAP